MRTSFPRAAVLLLTAVTLFWGCGRNSDPGDTLSQATPEQQQVPAPSVPLGEDEMATPADHNPTADQQVVPAPTNPLIRGVFDALGVSELDENGQLRHDLRQADTVLMKIKKENREALRQVNRQLRLPGPSAPNVILIVADELGCSSLGCYGQDHIPTPHIDTLAAEGMRFTQFVAGNPFGNDARWSLQTGRHFASDQPVMPTSVHLDSKEITVAEVLWQAGYDTAFIGRWGLTAKDSLSDPIQHGFDQWLGFRTDAEAGNHYPSFFWRDGGQFPLPENSDSKKQQFASDVLTQVALSFLSRPHDQRSFFLQLAYSTPHANLPAPHNEDNLNDDWTAAQKSYVSQVMQLDEYVGQIRERLEETGLASNTVIIFTSENGPRRITKVLEFLDSGWWTADLVNRQSGTDARVPFIVHWPGRVLAGSTSERLSSFCDLAPTLANVVAAIQQPDWIDGISLLPEFTGVADDEATEGDNPK